MKGPPLEDQDMLGKSESIVHRSRRLSEALFREAQRMPQYRRVLATRERCLQFEAKLKEKATWLNNTLDTKLPDDVVGTVVIRLSRRLAAWEHSPILQRERQKKQVAKRQRRNRGRDLQIVRFYENGESQRRIAMRFRVSRGAVEHVLQRDAPHLLKPRADTTDTSAAG